MPNRMAAFIKEQVAIHRRHVPLFFLTCFVVVFAGAILGEFVYDDIRWIQDNQFIRQTDNFKHFFSQEYFTGSHEMSYRPVVTASYMLDYCVFGVLPFGFRLHNLLLHLLVCCLLWKVLVNLTKSRAAAWWATFLFCFHPIVVEPVVIPSMREELQCAAFLLLSWLFIWHQGRWFLASLCYGLALLSKETALCFPLIVLAAIVLERRRKDPSLLPIKINFLRRMLTVTGLGAVTALYVLVRFVWMKTALEATFDYLGGNIWTSLLTHWTGWTRGLVCLVLPQNCTVDPWLPTQYSPWNIVVLSCCCVWMIFWWIFIWALFRNRVIAFGLIFFLIALLPVSGAMPIVNAYADRYFYIPLMGLCISAAAWISKLTDRGYRRFIPLGILCIGLLGGLSYQRVQIFHDNRTMWTDALAKLGKRPWPLCLLSLYGEQGKEPLALLQERVLREPDEKGTWTRLAAAYLEKGDFGNATRAFQISLQKDPNNPDIHLMQGDAYAQMKQEEKARWHYDRAIALNPKFAEAYNNLGVLFLNQKKEEQAKEEFKKALAIKPEFTAALCNLATAYADQEDYAPAVALWEKVLRIDKYHAAARWNILRLKNKEPFRTTKE